MATGSPVSFWYGTRAQFDSITTKLDTVLYFITDEQALYKGTVKFSGSGVDTLLTISATEPIASSVTTGDKYFNTSDNLIHVLKNENGTVTTTATYEPANGALYYNADAQRFQTLIKNGSSYTPTEIYDAGISVEDDTGLALNGTTVSGLDATTNSKGVVQVGSNLNVSDGVLSVPTATNAVFGVVKSGDNITNTNGVLSVGKATTSALGVVKVGSNIDVDNNGKISVPVADGSTKGVVQLASSIGSSETNVVTEALVREELDDLQDEINAKQDELSPGAGIALDGSVISATGAVSMTTTERMALTPAPGFLIWDTYLEKLFVGDGSTIGGKEIEGGGGGGGGEGTVTGIKASVSGNTATIIATGSTTSVKFVGVDGTTVSEGANGEIQIGGTGGGGGDVTEAEFKDLSDGTQSITKDIENARRIAPPDGYSPVSGTPLTILHFSDIHADSDALTRIMADRTALGTLVDDVICTGDMVDTLAGQINSWWNPAVMTVMGNHDVKVGNAQNALSIADRISYYISPFESNWGITRGEGVDWYYKDYTQQKVRLIVIDCMWYRNSSSIEATTQTAWVQGLLADAITNNLHVLIASHSRSNSSVRCYTSFNRFSDYEGYDTTICETPLAIVSAVASAISSGLKFVGYLTGHYHQDDIWDATGDGTQYFYSVTLANTLATKNISDQYRVGIDAFNLVTIDTSNTLVKLTRGGGANIDSILRPRQTITINYSTGEIIDTQRPKDGERLETKDGIQNVKRYIATKDVSGSSVTLQAGYGYKGTIATDLTLETEYVSGSQYGLESVLDLTLAGGTVSAGENVYIADTLTAGQRNICSVRFIDSIAIVNVLTVIASIPADAYAVSIATGTSDGSLYYGLATSTKTDIYISASLNGQTLDMGGAVTNGAKVVHGNGYTYTTVSGGVSATSTTTFTSLSMDGVSIVGGTMTMSGVNIPESATVSPVSGSIEMIDVVGGGTITLASYTGTSSPLLFGSTASVSGVTFIGKNMSAIVMSIKNSTLTMSGCTLRGHTGGTYHLFHVAGSGVANIDDCIVSGNSKTTMFLCGGSLSISGGTVTGNTVLDQIVSPSGGIVDIQNLLISGNSIASTSGQGINVTSGGIVTLTGATISGNTGGGNILLVGTGCSLTLSDTICSGNITSYGLGTRQNGMLTLAGGCTTERLVAYNGGKAALAGSNNVDEIYTTTANGAHIYISSGASINLTNSIGIGASGITVSEGGCVVNGASIPAGTYTSIVSSGGSAVAS